MNSINTQLNWLWRLLITGLCFVGFGLGGLLLSLLWFNVLLLLMRNANQRRYLARRSISASFRFFLTTAKRLGALDYRIDGADILRSDRGCLVVANHPTLIDYVLITSALPQTDCLVKSALLKNPFVSSAIRAADYLINSQGEALIAQSQIRLARGDTILIFPEGTRTQPGKKMRLLRGAANIALRCACDLRVVKIRCSQHLLDKKSSWYHVPPVKPLFSVSAQQLLHSRHFLTNTKQQPALAARKLNQHLLQQLQ